MCLKCSVCGVPIPHPEPECVVGSLLARCPECVAAPRAQHEDPERLALIRALAAVVEEQVPHYLCGGCRWSYVPGSITETLLGGEWVGQDGVVVRGRPHPGLAEVQAL